MSVSLGILRVSLGCFFVSRTQKEVNPSKIPLQMSIYYCIELQSSKLLFSCDINNRIASACCCQNLVFFLFSVCYIYYLGCKDAMLFLLFYISNQQYLYFRAIFMYFYLLKTDTEGYLYHALFTKKIHVLYIDRCFSQNKSSFKKASYQERTIVEIQQNAIVMTILKELVYSLIFCQFWFIK